MELLYLDFSFLLIRSFEFYLSGALIFFNLSGAPILLVWSFDLYLFGALFFTLFFLILLCWSFDFTCLEL